MTRTALYRHFAADGALLYVGISAEPIYRLTQHMKVASWRFDIANITIQWFEDRPEAMRAETTAIMQESPAHNRTSKPCAVDASLPHAALLTDIGAHLAKTGMSKSAFGHFGVGDPAFVADLEKGREPRTRVIARAQEYMATGVTHEAAKAKAGAA